MTKAAFSAHRIDWLRPLKDSVIVSDMTFTERTISSGIVLQSDNGKSAGVRPRWGQVYAIGFEQKDVSVGQWVMVAHGRWTRGIDIIDGDETKTLRKIDPKDILLISDTQPEDETMSDAV